MEIPLLFSALTFAAYKHGEQRGMGDNASPFILWLGACVVGEVSVAWVGESLEQVFGGFC